MFNVVGIAIAKSNNHVYAWYDDGTCSSGHSLNFRYYFKNKPYKLQGSPYDIRSMAIASNNHIYAWLSNSMAQSGWSENLSYHKPPYYYLTPPLNQNGNNPQKWYKDITLQNILDHKAGFQRDMDYDETYAMFDLDYDTLTYPAVVRHFVLTRPLKWAPGGSSAYSNFSFFIWGAIFPALTGKSFEEYALNNYLKPLGLNGLVRPATENTDSYDSCMHKLSGGKLKDPEPDGCVHKRVDEKVEFESGKKKIRVGAAGGWTASAGSLIKIVDHLQNTYTPSEIDDMGWGSTNSGILEHSGAIEGGMSYVVMYPKGYISVVTNGDLSHVDVALAANIRTETCALKSLAGAIAREVPESNVPADYSVPEPTMPGNDSPIDCSN